MRDNLENYPSTKMMKQIFISVQSRLEDRSCLDSDTIKDIVSKACITFYEKYAENSNLPLIPKSEIEKRIYVLALHLQCDMLIRRLETTPDQSEENLHRAPSIIKVLLLFQIDNYPPYPPTTNQAHWVRKHPFKLREEISQKLKGCTNELKKSYKQPNFKTSSLSYNCLRSQLCPDIKNVA